MKWQSLQCRRILLLADLHCGEYQHIKKIPWFAPRWKATFTGMTMTNLKRLFHYVARDFEDDIHHVIILGDLTVTGTDKEFRKALDALLVFQGRLFGSGVEPQGEDGLLNPEYFTVIPGNHDLNLKGWGHRWLALRLVTAGIRVWLLEKRQDWAQYKSLPRQCPETMARLLELFDEYFGNTIRCATYRPTMYPYHFGRYEKTLDGTNVRLVPLNTCASKPVTRVGLNATGVVLDDQIQWLNSPSDSDEESPDILRLALAHHFPLPIPLGADAQDRYLELHDAAETFNALYNSGRFSAFLCGHKHRDFIWTNSTMVPGVNQKMPVIAVGSTTFGVGTDQQRCCILEIEDRDLTKCTPETTLMRVKYHLLTPHGCEVVNQHEIIFQPSYYQRFVERTKRHVAVGRSLAGTVIKFLDFMDETVKDAIELPEDSPGDVRLEFSRWGTRLYGDSESGVVEFRIKVASRSRKGPILVRFSCRASEISKGQAELRIRSERPQTSRLNKFRIVEKTELVEKLVLREVRSDTRILVSFRSTGLVDMVFHYLRISTAT